MTLAEELVGLLGEKNVDSSPETVERFRLDESVRTPSANTPSFIVTPKDTTTVSKILRIANKHRTPVVAVGYMSSTHGSSVPRQGSIVLDFKSWNEILEIDTKNRLVTVTPGVTVMQLQKELEKHGFFLAHGPSTWFRASIGGAISCGSGGVFHLRYGRPIEQVVSLEIVLPTGEIIETGKKVHEPGFGYDLTRLIGPSEGTLGIITRATLRIYAIPESRLVEGYDFPSVSVAFEAVNELIDSGIFPETILGHNGRSHFSNFMPTVRKLQGRNYEQPIGKENIGCILVVYAGSKKVVDAQRAIGREIMQSFGGEVEDEFVSETWYKQRFPEDTRHHFSTGGENKHRHATVDCCVPRAMANELCRSYERVTKEHGFKPFSIAIAYAGYDASLRLVFGVQINKADNVQASNFQKCKHAMVEEILKAGGETQQVGDAFLETARNGYESSLVAMQRLKRAFDPNWILNPGKKIPEV